MKSTTIAIAAGCVLAALAAVGAYRSMLGGIEVQAARAELSEIRHLVDERGKTRLPKVHLITMPYEGRIAAIDLEAGAKVDAGEEVAELVARHVQLKVAKAAAAVDRLEASIRENQSTALERISLKQAENFAKAMQDAVKAAAARVTSGREKYRVASRQRERMEKLVGTAVSEENFDRAVLEEVQSAVDYDQDRLVHSAMLAIRIATDLLPPLVRQVIQDKQLTHDVLTAELEEYKALKNQAALDLERATITSPVDGVVLEQPLQNERVLSAGTVLMKIGRLEDLEIEAEVLSQDAAGVREGDPVEIYGPTIGDEPMAGHVHRVHPAGFTKVSSLGVEQQRVMVIVRFDEGELARLREQRNLGVEYRVRVRIITDRRSSAICIPRSALFRTTDGQWNVYAVRNGRAQRQPVEVGIMNDLRAEIVGGVEAGEQVVIAPASDLEDGRRVRVVDEG